jgi:hypothetical protein
LIRVPANGMKNSPMSEASRTAALALSGSAPANSFISSRPSRMLVSVAVGAGWPGSGAGPVCLSSRACP